MDPVGVAFFLRLAETIANSDKLAYPLAELNDLLGSASAEQIGSLPRPEITDPYRANYVAAMVELASHRAGVIPPAWTSDVPPLSFPVFADPSLNLRAHLLTAPHPFGAGTSSLTPASGTASDAHRRRIRELLKILNSQLEHDGIRGEISLAGGAVMCLVFHAREATKDIDALLVPSGEIRRAAEAVAVREASPALGWTMP